MAKNSDFDVDLNVVVEPNLDPLFEGDDPTLEFIVAWGESFSTEFKVTDHDGDRLTYKLDTESVPFPLIVILDCQYPSDDLECTLTAGPIQTATKLETYSFSISFTDGHGGELDMVVEFTVTSEYYDSSEDEKETEETTSDEEEKGLSVFAGLEDLVDAISNDITSDIKGKN